MKKLYLLLIFSSCSLSYSTAQTTLAAGDIAFTGYNSDDNTVNGATANDDICFILLRNISNGTVIFFTDFGWRSDASAFQSANPCGASTGALTDGIIQWTATANMSYGTQINIRCKNNLTATAGTVTGIQTISGGTDYLSLALGGDQVFAYQGSFASPVLLAGINMNGGWDASLTNCTLTSSQSVLPAALSAGNFAMAISPEVDNGRIRTSVLITGTAATDRLNIHNPANWDTDDATAFVLPAVLTVLPVKFTYVRVSQNAGIATLQWGVADEQDIEKYVIERSVDGMQYSDVGQVAASGLSGYDWRDPVSNGVVYYRVRAEEFSGQKIYTAVLRYNGTRGLPAISISRVGAGLLLRTSQLPTDRYTLSVFSSAGQLYQHTPLRIFNGEGYYPVPLQGRLAPGIYSAILHGEGKSFSCRFYMD